MPLVKKRANVEKNYQFIFYKVLGHAQCRNELRKYMKNVERNDELLSFYEGCEMLYAQTDITKAKEQVKEIYDTFISRTSYQQINISAETVRKVTQQCNLFLRNDNALVAECLVIFKPALDSVINSLENDVFVRFVRNEEWIKFVTKKFKSNSDLEQIAEHKSQRQQMLLTLKDEERSVMTWRDIEFALNMMRDGVAWKLKYSSKLNLRYVDSIMLFNAKVRVTDDELDKRGSLTVVKQSVLFNVSAKDLFTCMHAGEKHEDLFGDPNLFKNTRLVKSTTDESTEMSEIELNSKQYSYCLDLSIPLVKNRVSTICFSCIHLPKSGRYLIVFKPMPDILPEEPDHKNLIRMRLYCWTVIEPIDENKCRWTVVTGAWMGGKLVADTSFAKWANNKVGINTYLKILKKNNAALIWYIDEMNRPQVRDDSRCFELVELNKSIAGLVEKRLGY